MSDSKGFLPLSNNDSGYNSSCNSVVWECETPIKPESPSEAELIPQLLELLKDSDNVVVEKAAETLTVLSKEPAHRILLMAMGATPDLADLLESQHETILTHGLIAVHYFVLHEPGFRDGFIKARGLERLLALLHHTNEMFICIAADCIRWLAYRNLSVKLAILNMNGTSRFVQLFGQSTSEHLVDVSLQALRTLSSECPDNARKIIECDGIDLLSNHLANKHPFDLNCLRTIRNLSNFIYHREDLYNLIRQLLTILEQIAINTSPEIGEFAPEVVEMSLCVTLTLTNLTYNNATNKSALYSLNGVEVLINIINIFSNYEKVAEMAVCTLRHISLNHNQFAEAQQSIVQMGAVPLMLSFLDNSNEELKKAVVLTIRNLALNPRNLPVLVQLDVKKKLLDLYMDELALAVTSGNYYPSDGLANETEKTIQVIEDAIKCI